MSWDDWATGPQLHRIAVLAHLVSNPYPVEEREMSRAQARNEIYLLRGKLRSKNQIFKQRMKKSNER